MAVVLVHIRVSRKLGEWDDEEFVKSFQLIFGTILACLEPPEPEVIDGFCKLSDGLVKCMHTIEKFGCVLRWDPDLFISNSRFPF